MKITSLLSCGCALVLSACSSQIQHGLDERDANEIVSALVARGFEPHKVAEKGKKPTWAIELDEAQATDALRVLAELKLPRPPRSTTRELASQSALIETPTAERMRQLEAQEGDIEQSLETMDGVTSAAVELVVPLPPRPGLPASPSKASVLLRVTAEANERLQQQRPELRGLVAGAVDGLHADDVVLVIDVVSTPAPTVATQTKQGPPVTALAVVLALTLVLLLGLATMFAVRLKRAKPLPRPATAVSPPPTSTTTTSSQATPRPVINPALQRKVVAP